MLRSTLIEAHRRAGLSRRHRGDDQCRQRRVGESDADAAECGCDERLRQVAVEELEADHPHRADQTARSRQGEARSETEGEVPGESARHEGPDRQRQQHETGDEHRRAIAVAEAWRDLDELDDHRKRTDTAAIDIISSGDHISGEHRWVSYEPKVDERARSSPAVVAHTADDLETTATMPKLASVLAEVHLHASPSPSATSSTTSPRVNTTAPKTSSERRRPDELLGTTTAAPAHRDPPRRSPRTRRRRGSRIAPRADRRSDNRARRPLPS